MLSSEAAEMKALTALSSTSKTVLPLADARPTGGNSGARRGASIHSAHSAKPSSTVKTLLAKDRKRLEDRVWRAYGMLKHARLLPSDEAMMLLSAVRMGVNLGLIDRLTIHTVNELFIQTQPAHLQKLEGRKLESPERDIARASFIRGRLEGLN